MTKKNGTRRNPIRQKSPQLVRRSFFYIIVLCCFSFLSGCNGLNPPSVALKPGAPAADFTLSGARNGTFNLKDLRGQAVLLSFINTQADAYAPTPSPSRAQITFLKSMYQQYAPKGLTVLIIDAAQLETGKQTNKDDLINFTYNWQLDTIPVLMDEDGKTRFQFGVSSVPTTLLIGEDGIIQQRWDHVASASQLALAIEAIVGAPFYRETSVNATPTIETKSCAGETPGQAKFSGVGLARALSEQIWAIDKGEAWQVGGGYPLQWIILDTSDKAGNGTLQLKVTGRYFNTKEFVLLDQPLQALPDDEAHGLLGAKSDSLLKVYLLTTTIALEKPGCLQVQAVVTDKTTGANLYNGETFVTVK